MQEEKIYLLGHGMAPLLGLRCSPRIRDNYIPQMWLIRGRNEPFYLPPESQNVGGPIYPSVTAVQLFYPLVVGNR